MIARARFATVALALLLSATQAAAADDSAALLAKARAAFDETDFDAAADAYQTAIDKGNLAPGDLAEAFLRVGIAFATQGKSKKALDAFRLAVIVDAAIPFPAAGPKKAKPLLEQARREMAKRTGDWFRLATLERPVAIGSTAATARVRLDAVAGLEAVEVEARSGEGEPWVQRLPLAAETAIVLPKSLHGSGRVRLRVAAVDDVGNRWAEIVRSVDVERLPQAAPPAAAVAAEESGAKARRRRDRDGENKGTVGAAATGTGTPASSASLWSSPWPWVAVGTVVLGVAGAYTYAVLDASSPARVGAPRVTPGP